MKKVAVVIVTYNRLELLKEEIESIRKQTYTENDIVVVNNSSTDGTLEWLNTQDDIITITQGNVGGAGGFFAGMKYATENGYDFCWIMDDDVYCHPDSLEKLMEAYNERENMGFVCSMVHGLDGLPMNSPAADQRPTANGYTDAFDLLEKQMMKVKQATFVSVLFSCKIIEEVGLPYKEFFIWGDDIEYTLRISANHPCYVIGSSKVIHKRTVQANIQFKNETNERRLNNFFYSYRNRGFFKKKYGIDKNYIPKTIIEMVSLFFSGKTKQASIIFRALCALTTFHPKVVYPKQAK